MQCQEATRTCLTQAGARASNTFCHGTLGSMKHRLPSERRPKSTRLPTLSARPKGFREATEARPQGFLEPTYCQRKPIETFYM